MLALYICIFDGSSTGLLESINSVRIRGKGTDSQEFRHVPFGVHPIMSTELHSPHICTTNEI